MKLDIIVKNLFPPALLSVIAPEHKCAFFIKNIENICVSATTQKLWEVYGGYVVTSATTTRVGGQPETYVFHANVYGSIVDYREIAGSFKGALDHQRAIDGYVASL